MSRINIRELIPQECAFRLSGCEGREFVIRPINVSDELWIQEMFGESFDKIFSPNRLRDLCRVIFHQMTDEDKKFFSSKNVEIVNEEGDSSTLKLGGYRLMMAYAQGMRDKVILAEALMESMGFTKEVRDAIAKASDPEEKKTSSPPPASTTDGPLTSSQPSTDGLQNTSSLEPEEKSDGVSKPSSIESIEIERLPLVSMDEKLRFENLHSLTREAMN